LSCRGPASHLQSDTASRCAVQTNLSEALSLPLASFHDASASCCSLHDVPGIPIHILAELLDGHTTALRYPREVYPKAGSAATGEAAYMDKVAVDVEIR
jgi:hypothetical protein